MKSSIPFRQMSLRLRNYRKKNSLKSDSVCVDPDMILRIAEYQGMVYCKPDAGSFQSDVSVIENMAKKNLRVCNSVIEATRFDKQGYLFWYITSNIA